MSDNIVIPEKIKKLVLKKKITRICFFAVLLALNLFIIVMWGDSIIAVEEEQWVFKYTCYILFMLLPIPATKIYKIFTDKSYCGIVNKIDVKTTVDSTNSASPTVETLYRKNEIYLTVETPSGNIVKQKADETAVRLNSKLEKYKVGDTVLHLHGTKVTVVLPNNSDTLCRCAVCGETNGMSNTHCTQCNFPLIKG